MPPPMRSRSLRQPGYSHRELVADGQNAAIASKNVVDDKRPPRRLETQGRKTLDHGVAHYDEEPQDLSVNVADLGEGGGERHVQQRVPPRRSTMISVPAHRLHPHDPQTGVKLERHGAGKATSRAGGNASSSGLPLPAQPSRESLHRRKSSVVKGDEAKRLLTRNPTVTGTLTSSSSLRKSMAPATKAKEDFPGRPQSISLPREVSSALEPVRRRAQPTVVLPEPGDVKALPSAQNRFNAGEKPPFSTYQQRFSPRKQKALMECTKVAPSTSHTCADASHFTALQDELLQLQCIYLCSHQNLRTWTETGEASIREQNRRTVQEACEVGEMEQNQQKCINGAALQEWLARGKGIERVESLAQCVQMLTDLSQPNQSLSQVVEQFEAWFESMGEALTERTGDNQSVYPRFLQRLGQSWTDTVTALIGSVDSCLVKLQGLGSGDRLSGLGLVLDGHARLGRNILEELKSMEAIHALVLEQEEDSILRQVSGLLVSDNEAEESPCDSKRLAAWERWP